MENQESATLGRFGFGARVIFSYTLAGMAVPVRFRNTSPQICWFFLGAGLYDFVFGIGKNLRFQAS